MRELDIILFELSMLFYNLRILFNEELDEICDIDS